MFKNKEEIMRCVYVCPLCVCVCDNETARNRVIAICFQSSHVNDLGENTKNELGENAKDKPACILRTIFPE